MINFILSFKTVRSFCRHIYTRTFAFKCKKEKLPKKKCNRKEFESLGGVSRQNASLSLVRFSEKKEGQNGEENTKNLLKKNNRDEKIF